MTEQVINPAHYGGADNPYETIKVLKDWLTPEEFNGFCRGNCLKYLSRSGKKDGEPADRDFKKALWYLDQLIDVSAMASRQDHGPRAMGLPEQSGHIA